MTNRDRVLAALADSPVPLDDDQLARTAGIEPRQNVNQVCRRLAAEGVVTRLSGPDGKIVNSLIDNRVATSAPADGFTPSASLSAAPGSSTTQRVAEVLMLAALERVLGVKLVPRRLTHPSGAVVDVDGVDDRLTILVECWAHQGAAKVGQKSKLINDAVKLNWIAKSLAAGARRLIICVSDEAAVAHLRGRSWQGQAISELGVELMIVALPDDTVAEIAAAQVRQFR